MASVNPPSADFNGAHEPNSASNRCSTVVYGPLSIEVHSAFLRRFEAE